MYRVEYRNDRGDWILAQWTKTRAKADVAAEAISESYTARIISNGKILHYFERVTK